MRLFFFNDTATTEIYTLSLHDALPIWRLHEQQVRCVEHVDRLLERLFHKCPKGTHVILTSDHGELFGEANYFGHGPIMQDRKSTRLNSSHANISYAVFCLQKNIHIQTP